MSSSPPTTADSFLPPPPPPPLPPQDTAALAALLTRLEASSLLLSCHVSGAPALGALVLAPTLDQAFALAGKTVTAKCPALVKLVDGAKKSEQYEAAVTRAGLCGGSGGGSGGGNGGDKKKDKKGKDAPAPILSDIHVIPYTPTTTPAPLDPTDYGALGLMSSLRMLFTAALIHAFPQVAQAPADLAPSLTLASITRCGNPAFGDFQCNNAMGLGKWFKTLGGFGGPVAPKDIATALAGG